MLNFVSFKVNGFIDQPGVNLSQFQVINRLYSRAGGDTSPKFLFGKSGSGAVRFLDSLS